MCSEALLFYRVPLIVVIRVILHDAVCRSIQCTGSRHLQPTARRESKRLAWKSNRKGIKHVLSLSHDVAVSSNNLAAFVPNRISVVCLHYTSKHMHRRTGQGGRGGAVAPLGFGKLVKFGQMGWEIRAFRGLNFSR